MVLRGRADADSKANVCERCDITFALPLGELNEYFTHKAKYSLILFQFVSSCLNVLMGSTVAWLILVINRTFWQNQLMCELHKY